jgi:RNA polymerase subunit RPABC4/transcription elongation factor Spt4
MRLAADNVISMIHCQNCGQGNAPESQFCRFCGTRMTAPQHIRQDPPQGFSPPRPYAWKTDEYQTQADARRPNSHIPQVEPLANANYSAQPVAYAAPGQFAGNYRCPSCMSQFLPITEKRVSTAGWIVFALFLVFFFPLFWIGLLIKEDVHVCPTCKTRIR